MPDLAGPEVRTVEDLARAYLAAARKHRPILPIRLPGRVFRGYRAGGHLAPERAVGTIGFEQYLGEQLAAGTLPYGGFLDPTMGFGGELVHPLLPAAIISAANWSETWQKLHRHSVDADRATQLLRTLGLRVEPLTEADAVTAATLWTRTRTAGLSLGDRCCLALEARLNLPTVLRTLPGPNSISTSSAAHTLSAGTNASGATGRSSCRVRR